MKPLHQLETGSFTDAPDTHAFPDAIRAICWNINRGQELNRAIEFLVETAPDLVLLQEADLHARRTERRNVAREIAKALKMNYVFGCEFEELSQRKNGIPAYHGQATLSRFPLSASRILRFSEQSNFWRPRWFIPRLAAFQRRLGGRMALVSCVDLPGQKLMLYNVHLESRGNDGLRYHQLREILNDVSHLNSDVQVVVAGDFNTNLLQGSFAAIVGKAGFANPFAHVSRFPATVRSHFTRPRAIDWILSRGPLIPSGPMIHDSIQASDHYPLSLTLRRIPYPKCDVHNEALVLVPGPYGLFLGCPNYPA